MKKLPLLFVVLFVSSFANASEIVKIPLFDGETLTGKLELPADGKQIREIVIYIHGTGPGTYNDHRKIGSVEFNYFDPFAQEFNKRGIAFFSYNKRGVEIGDQPPFYDRVDREKFKKVIPSIEIKDIASVIAALRKNKRLKDAKVVLLGWSEGSVLAAMAGEDKRNKVAAIFLAGYVNDNLAEVIKWQNTGGSTMVTLRRVFDADKNGSIGRAEYESTDTTVTAFRTGRLQNGKFEQVDVNKDDAINAEDFGIILKPRYQAILDAIGRGDDDWIWKNYFRITTAWLKEHFALEANKDRLLRLRIPIYIFHGASDANVPVEGVYDLRARFDKAKKKNLHEYIFERHDHDLNYLNWVMKKEMPEGIRGMFEVSESLNR
ncbi:MAG: alpha/beta fold hydrolase [Pyrinomonadaceae bacterium]|nr:alpha/beta fold hydrolase [Pyrinomonadaceae bacterium]